MTPLSIRLSGIEAVALLMVLRGALDKLYECPKHKRGSIRIETIVLNEYYPTWWKKTAALAVAPSKQKDPTYRIPVSICRIVHYRLQHLPYSDANQMLIKRLDKALLNSGYRPEEPIPIVS